MDKLRMETPDLTSENIEKIAAIFPNCVTEMRDENGKLKRGINFEMLKQMLSPDVVDGDECYEFTWVGKKASIVEANKPIRKTLRPCPEESKNWDTTENLYIEGDNLEVLKLLQESYLGKIRVIYIDPPYNTGNDFIYRDNFTRCSDEYDENSGIYDEDENKLFRNTDSNGRFHSDWCSMIYPRLMLARSLLSDDGAIFVSIDEHELSDLIKIMNEVFGEDNFIDAVVWDKKSSAKGVPPRNMMANVHEYIVVYEKAGKFRFTGERRNEKEDGFKNPDNDPRGPWRESNIKSTTKPMEEAFTITDPHTGRQYTNTWAFSKESIDRMIQEGRILWKESLPKQKEFMYELTNENKAIKSDWGLFDAQSTTVFLKKLIPEVKFDNPKPINLMKYLIEVATKQDDIILDFFSGSATTAQAIMELNATSNEGHRKFIMVQLQEPCDKQSEAYKAGYTNICEIGKERIRRAGDQLKSALAKDGIALRKMVKQKNEQGTLMGFTYAEWEESPEVISAKQKMADELDTGFRVLKLDDSNMTDVYYAADEYDQGNLTDMVSNIKEDRTDLDLLFGCLLDWGLPLSLPYQSEQIDGCTVHTYNDGDLIACFDANVPESVVKEIAKRKPLRAVFRDSSFADSPSKINVFEIFKLYMPEDADDISKRVRVI